jgi:hypothetical protein
MGLGSPRTTDDRPTSIAVVPREAQSGLDPWGRGELPAPPAPTGVGWLAAVGPGVIVLGLSIGSGEFLLGPAAFVQYGFTLLWVTAIAVFLQTIFNTEVLRYTLATGEPGFTAFMRTRPSSDFWAGFYLLLYVLQVGWPAWAGSAAAAVFFLIAGRLPDGADGDTVYGIGVAMFLLCVAALLVGRRIERTLELLNWVLVVFILAGFFGLALLFVRRDIWFAAVAGYAGFDLHAGEFRFLPTGADFFLLGALAAYSGCGGVGNITLSNWARDKGYGMSQLVGYIPAAFGGQRINLAHTGCSFTPTDEAMRRWRGWWRIVWVDQWVIFFVGALLGMALPAMLYVAFLPHGTDIRGPGVGAALAQAMAPAVGGLAAGAVAFMGAWILLKTQLDIVEGMTRAITDILWTGSRRVRAWRGGDVRIVYYAVLVIITLWGIVALRLAAPIVLLQLSANLAAVVLIVAALHILYVNTTLLPPPLRPPLWRRAALVATALFYGVFVTLSVSQFF